MLLIDGDAARVYDRYATQLAEVSTGLAPASSAGPCGFRDGQRVRDREAVDAAAPLFPIECSGRSDLAQASLWRSSGADGAAWADHLVLSIHTGGGDGADQSEPTDLDAVGPPPGLLPDPGPAPRPPQVGEPISEQLDGVLPPVRVAEGSELVAFPAPLASATGGIIAVARITGDPSDVVARYVDQNPYREPVHRAEYEVDGRSVLQSQWTTAGGPGLIVTATTDERGDWYALISTSTG